MANWMVGFLSGSNYADVDGPDFLRGIDQHAVAAWVDNYCAANRNNRIAHDILALTDVGSSVSRKSASGRNAM